MSAVGFDNLGAKRIVDAVRRVESAALPQATQLPGRQRWSDRDRIPIIIKAKTEYDSPTKYRFTYTVSQVRKVKVGYESGAWEEITDENEGIVSATAYNLIEYMNQASDGSSPTIQGNGIDIDRAGFPTATMLVQPAPINLITFAWPVYAVVSGVETFELWFAYENAIDGTCS